MAYTYGYKIAPNHDAAGSLVDIQTIIPTGDKYFVAPRAYSGLDDGLLRVRADGLNYLTGFKSFTWLFDVLTVKQYQYLIATYSTGGTSYSGKVTVRTRGLDGTFANYNAILQIPKLGDLTRRYLNYRGVELKFTRAVAI